MLAVALILSVVVAAPSRLQVHRREDAHPLCRGTLLYSQAQCCDLNALGVAGLGCTPSMQIFQFFTSPRIRVLTKS